MLKTGSDGYGRTKYWRDWKVNLEKLEENKEATELMWRNQQRIQEWLWQLWSNIRESYWLVVVQGNREPVLGCTLLRALLSLRWPGRLPKVKYRKRSGGKNSMGLHLKKAVRGSVHMLYFSLFYWDLSVRHLSCRSLLQLSNVNG